jgi:disulfide bond formation protein DsbB
MNILQRRAIGAAAVSLVVLLVALGFQYLGGLAPCPLCIWQRWPHGIAALLGLVILAWPNRGLAMLGMLVMLAGAAIAIYHTGIEADWWSGPVTCSAATGVSDLSTDALTDQLLATPVVRCDEVAWSLWGISMAGWNAIVSLILAWLWWRAYASSSASQYR